MKLLPAIKRKLTTSDQERLARLTVQLAEADAAREAAYVAIGEASADELSTKSAAENYEAAITRSRDLTAAIKTVEERIQAATERARVQEMRQKREAFRETLAVVQEKAQVLDADFEELNAHGRDLAKAIAEAAAAGRSVGADAESLTNRLVRGKLTFDAYAKFATTLAGNFSLHITRHGLYSAHFPKPDEI
ncbi:MAG: hypothetical protein LZF60_250002 [Nitrospira sp.]|nr:hypothetical protein [Nitrospira sp.]ULA60425.1 MAG: hypothetical protein LZF60_250002 [Nitrospira sp.]